MSGQSVLRRMTGQAGAGQAGAGQAPEASAAAPPPGVRRVWPLAMARAARDECGLLPDTGPPEVASRSLAELLELAPELPLIAVLEGPGEDLGVLFLSQPVLAALIEAQTTGRVTDRAAPPRRPTRTDAAMVAGVLDRALEGLEAGLQAAPEAADDLLWAGGFRYASFLEDLRPLGLILDDGAYRVVTVELGLGGKSGPVMLALPAEGARRRAGERRAAAPRAGGDPGAEAATGARAPDRAAVLGAATLDLPVTLHAVLARPRLRLAEVLALTPGQILPLPQASLAEVALVGVDGVAAAEGRLGQMRGMRALRLTRIEGADPVPSAPAAPGPRPHLRPAVPHPGPEDAPAAIPDPGAALARTGTGG